MLIILITVLSFGIIAVSLSQMCYALYFGHDLAITNYKHPTPLFAKQTTTTEKGDVYVVWAENNNKTGDSNIEFISSNDCGQTFSPKKELISGKSISFSPQLAVTEKGDLCAVRCGLT
jgi:hypothetical protein